MLSIKIEGQEIYIKKNTSISMELNNSIFNTEKIEGDIIFTFDVPAEGNDIIFNHARYVYIHRKKSYDATICVGGIEIANGKLILQNSKPDIYSCGVIVNPYPSGFSEGLLKDNEYGENGQLGVINKDYFSQYNILYKIIIDSLNPDSNIKFARFIDANFYGTDNEDFVGMLNKLVVVNNSKVVEVGNRTRDFKNYNYDGNRLALTPQIRLVFLFKLIFESIGYTLTGEILKDPYFSKFFYQSLNALDGLITDMDSFTIVNRSPTLKGLIGVNIFTTDIQLHNHTPNLTNSELINTICDLFGCTYFIDSNTRTVEMSFVKDLDKSGWIDLSSYLLSKETTIGHKEEAIYSYKLGSVLEGEVDTAKYIGQYNYRSIIFNGFPSTTSGDRDYLEYAGVSQGKICFVRDENKFYQSEKNKETNIWEWIEYCGNVKEIYYPEDIQADKKDINPNVQVPILRWMTTIYDVDIPIKGNSRIFNTDEIGFDFILTYDRGEYSSQGDSYSILRPVNPSNLNDFNLTVDGDNSIGEIYIKPYLKLLENHEEITCKFIFPLHVFMEVWNLFKPQSGEIRLKKRWIMINNIKLLPIQIKFEFTESKNTIKSEIKMAKPGIEI